MARANPKNVAVLTTEAPVDPSGNRTLVDAHRLAELSRFRWRIRTEKNGRRYVWRANKATRRHVMLHTEVYGPIKKGMQVDHKNTNSMDNREDNLREVTRQQNLANRGPNRGNQLGLKGVCWDRSRKKWYAAIMVKGKYHSLGRFDCPIAAARVYDDAARMLLGKFAWLNFPNDSTAPPFESSNSG